VVERIRAIARGLIGLGVQPGDRVALMSHTRLEWPLIDHGILAAGAVTVPIYETSSAEQIAWIVSDSGAVAIVLETAQHAALYAEVADRLPDCRRSFVLEHGGLDALLAAGTDVSDDDVDERIAAITHDDLATIIYTSGTTGRPKGCVLTQGNLCTNIAQGLQAWDDGAPGRRHDPAVPAARPLVREDRRPGLPAPRHPDRHGDRSDHRARGDCRWSRRRC
jgi:long-chain acyl-CoA synthetase